MDPWLVAAALCSALLHAAWNASVKAHARPSEAMAAQMIVSALLALGGVVLVGPPVAAAWPWVALSTGLNMASVAALLRAYRQGAFGTVYPMTRATAVLGVAAVAPLLLGERLGAGPMLGLGLIVGALLLLAWDTRRPGSADFTPAALGWTLTAGAMTACTVLSDAHGVRASGSAVSYGCTVSITNALAMAWLQRAAGPPWQLVRQHARVAVPAAAAAMVSYLLILWVFGRAPVAPAAALRDTSAVFAMIIAALWFGERLRGLRWLVLVLALSGVPLLRLG